MIRRRKPPALELAAVWKRYGRTRVLENASVRVHKGSIVGLFARNGAGKSTVISLLAGFMRPSGGSVYVLGRSPCSPELLGRVAALPQNVSLTGEERVQGYLEYLARLSFLPPSAAALLLERLDLTRVARQRAAELSEGFQRRVVIAAALLGKPEVLLLDEPTAGLEPAAVDLLHQLLRELRPSAATLVTSPSPSGLDGLCDEVLELHDGRIDGTTPDEADPPGPLAETERESMNGSAAAHELRAAENTTQGEELVR